jgi:hypothetical protein
MRASVMVSRVGSYSLAAQCVLLLIAVPAIAFKLGALAGWLFTASLVAGLLAFSCGIAASLLLRQGRWLGLSAAAVFVAFFSVVIGLSLGGGPGV